MFCMEVAWSAFQLGFDMASPKDNRLKPLCNSKSLKCTGQEANVKSKPELLQNVDKMFVCFSRSGVLSNWHLITNDVIDSMLIGL